MYTTDLEFEHEGQEYWSEWDLDGTLLALAVSAAGPETITLGSLPAVEKAGREAWERENEREIERAYQRDLEGATGGFSPTYRAQMRDAGRGHAI